MSDSDSDQEILASTSKSEKFKKNDVKSKEFLSSSSGDSSDSDDGVKSREKEIDEKSTKIKARNLTPSKSGGRKNSASEDEEPSCSTLDAGDKDDKNRKSEKRPRIDSSSSEEGEHLNEPSPKSNEEKNKRKPKKNKREEKLKAIKDEDSDTELNEKMTILKEKEDEKENAKKNSSKFEDDFETQKKKPDKESNNEKSKKKSISENQLDKLKKFVRAAGLRIQNYATFFENCKNDKRKVEELRNFFVEKGLTGKLSMKACQKFKLERETEREIAELDTNNILSNERPKRRNVSSLFNVRGEPDNDKVNDEDSDEIDEDYLTTKTRLSRLKGIIDSENDEN